MTNRPQQSAIKGLNFPPPTFGGDETTLFSAWRREYEEYGACMGWTDEHKLRGLSMVLSGRAKQMYQDLPAGSKVTWTSAIRGLENRFDEASPSSLTTFTLLDRVQQHGETVRKYTVDMVHRLRTAKVTNEQHRLAYYYKGLLPAIKRAVFILQPKTLEECEKQAMIVEDNFRMNGGSNTTVAEEDVAIMNTARSKDTTATATQNNRQRHYHNRHAHQGNQHGRQQNPPAGPPQHDGQNGQQQNQEQDKGQSPLVYCHQCRERHAWRKHTDPTCGKCGRRGHVKYDCRDF